MDRLVGFERPAVNQPGQDAAEEIVAVKQGDEELEFALRVRRRGRDVADDFFEQRLQRAFAQGRVLVRIAVAARGIEYGEIELLIRGFERDEQVEYLVQHLLNAFVRPVDLVDHDDRLEPQRKRLAGHELGLRHRPFGTVDQQDDPVDHAQDAFHLGAEIGVTGRVDDVDPVAVPFDRGRLRQNRDPAFLLQVVGIHRALFHALVVAEGPGLTEKLVNQRGLAVVDVGDDRHIA